LDACGDLRGMRNCTLDDLHGSHQPAVLTRRLYLGKGQLVDLEGRLQTRQWDDDAGKGDCVRPVASPDPADSPQPDSRRFDLSGPAVAQDGRQEPAYCSALPSA
jgi:hypothetical protein